MNICLTKKYILTIAAVFLLMDLSAQLITIETHLDTQKVELGRTAELKYIINKNTNDVVFLPAFGDTIFDGIEIVGDIKVDSSKLKDKKELLEQTLHITSYEIGMRYIPAQPFLFKSPIGEDTLMSNPTYLEVVGVAIDTTGVIRDIAPVEWVMPTLEDLWPLFLALILIVAIIVLIIYASKQKNKDHLKDLVIKKIEPAHIIALRELDKLKAQKLWQQGLVKDYYSKLTEIVRKYIEDQYQVKALEETTREILEDIRNIGVAENLNMKQLEYLLNIADLVKFAKGEVNPEENLEQLEVAYSFIKESRKAVLEDDIQASKEALDEKLSSSYSLSVRMKKAKGLSDFDIYNMLDKGAKIVQYSYVISIIVMTFSLKTKPYLIPKGSNGKKEGVIFSVITILLGWWGIPWGPLRSVGALKINFSGGKKVQMH